ncbi:hypothetical protein QQF64_019023 [Cirrhinus molitorella]|uniref:L1 transposable element RRM domain-containing protein n=1 Tax=Cirrhinus molitorella TaxID=172907 RepID=A0ABR3LEB1_9TELE
MTKDKKRNSKSMDSSSSLGACVTVDFDSDSGALVPLPETPLKEPKNKKGRNDDDDGGDGDLQSPLATEIITSLKSVINERADILDKGIKEVKMSVEFLTEEIKVVKGKVEQVDKRMTTAEKRIGELENKVQDFPDIRGGGICGFMFIDVVHRLGKVRSESALSSGQKPRGVILQFTMRHFRDALWKAAKNSPYLAKHHLRFAEDLSPEDREQRNKLWPLVEKARQQGRRAHFVGPKAYIDGKELVLQDMEVTE